MNHFGMMVIEPLKVVMMRSNEIRLMICMARCLEDRMMSRGRWAVVACISPQNGVFPYHGECEDDKG